MPRISRRIKRRRRPTKYTARHIRDLETGRADFFGDLFGGDFGTRADAWRELKGTILANWIAEHPGTRPWGWWEFDTPARRERADGKLNPFDREDYPENLKTLSFGAPHNHLTREDLEADYETEADFLRRHRLLEPEEIEALK